MNIPENFMYTRSHEWVQLNGDTAKIGLADFAQKSLGDIVFVNLPAEGDSLKAGECLGDVESVKAVSDILSPISGTVTAVNEELLDTPEKINQDPYGSWMVEVCGISVQEVLLDASAYRAFCEAEAQ